MGGKRCSGGVLDRLDQGQEHSGDGVLGVKGGDMPAGGVADRGFV